MAASMRLLGLSRQGKTVATNIFNRIAATGGSLSTPYNVRHLATAFNRLNVHPMPAVQYPLRAFSSANPQQDNSSGKVDKHEFKAETQKLLEIVANSLYSDNEVFIRELISNASDALEKFRYLTNTAGDSEKQYQSTDRSLSITLEAKKQTQQLIIKDNGIGMTKAELIENLGTIARSGSKQFLKQYEDGGNNETSNIIGQFGVGFYSAFMVADRIDVLTKSSQVGSVGLKWSSDGTGTFEIEEVDNVDVGTTIILHLKQTCREFSDGARIENVIKKYSNFVGFPVLLDGKQINELQPVWLMDPKKVTQDQYNEFYRFISNADSKPQYTIHYKADVPVSIRSLLYIPEVPPSFLDMDQSDGGISLYSRKILIQSGYKKFLPKWLRFVKGVVDSEDIPLNLSRELLQNSALINKISRVLTARIIRHLEENSKKDPLGYMEFYSKYSAFIYEGMFSAHENTDIQGLSKLLRYVTSNGDEPFTKVTSLEEYCSRAPETQKSIYYMIAPNRESAMASPIYQNLTDNGTEVILCLNMNDEMVFHYLKSFAGKEIQPAETAMRLDSTDLKAIDFGADSLPRSQINELTEWMKTRLVGKAEDVVATNKAGDHPCVVTVQNIAQIRNVLLRGGSQIPTDKLMAILNPRLEVNPAHPIIKKLFELKTSNPELSELLVEQLFINAVVSARLVENTQTLFKPLHKLLEKMLEKY